MEILSHDLILKRCKYSAEAVGLDIGDLNKIINNFELMRRIGVRNDNVGNIIKLICTLIEEKQKRNNV